jgi:hypothetical protein
MALSFKRSRRNSNLFKSLFGFNPAKSAYSGPNHSGALGEVNMEKVKVEDAKVVPGKTQCALKAGPHGKQKNADGTAHSTPNRHGPTDGGKSGTGTK